MLDKLDQATRVPQYLIATLLGLALDELSMWRLRRDIRRRYGSS